MSNPASRIAAAYAVVALAWVLISDRLLFGIAGAEEALALSVAKGAAFVAVSALALYYALRRSIAHTERARGEAEARRRQYETLIRSIRDYVFTVDSEGTCTAVLGPLPAARRFAARLVGQPFARAFDEDAAGHIDDLLRRAMHGESVLDTIQVVRLPGERSDGLRARPMLLEMSLSPLLDEHGEVEGVVGLARSVTAQAAMRNQILHLERAGTLGTLMAGIAHDFNNVLSVNRMSLDLIEPTDERGRRALDMCQRALDRAGELVQRMLRYARNEPGHAPAPVSLAAVAREVVDLFRGGAGRTIEVETDIHEVPEIRGDALQLEQAMLNLLMNARDAVLQDVGPDYSPRITLSIRAFPHDGTDPPRFVRVAVEDNGPGVPADLTERVFDPFFTTKPGVGNGIGLSSVLGIVREHGGSIQLHARAGGGARFEMDFPLPDARDSPRVAQGAGAGR